MEKRKWAKTRGMEDGEKKIRAATSGVFRMKKTRGGDEKKKR